MSINCNQNIVVESTIITMTSSYNNEVNNARVAEIEVVLSSGKVIS